MKDLLRRGLAMLMSVIMTLSLFVDCLPMEAYAADTENIASEGYRPQVMLEVPEEPEPTITVTSDRENNTLDYIGDTLTLTATLQTAEEIPATKTVATEWKSSDESVATVYNGVVTAKNFGPTSESDLERTVTITVTKTVLAQSEEEENQVFTAEYPIKVVFFTQPLFYYALIPGHDENITNGNGDKDWFGIGVEIIAGAKIPTGKSRDVGNLQYAVVGTRNALFPNITYEGKTYTHNSTSGDGYTLDQFRIVSDSTANGGQNGYNNYNGSIDPAFTYHVDHRLNFTEPGDWCNVHFMVRYPGETQPTLDRDSRQTVKKDTSESAITRPSGFNNITKDEIEYKFVGWYTDDEFSEKADFQGTITDNTWYYGHYVPTQAKYQIKFFYDNIEDQGRSVTKIGRMGAAINASDAEIDKLIQDNAIPGYHYSMTTPSSITLTEGGENEINVYYTRRNFTVSYEVDGKPAGISDPKGGSYPFEAQVTTAEMDVPGYDFSGWTTTDIDGENETTVLPGASFAMPSNHVTLKGTLTAKKNTPYKVEHYQQNINDNGYTLKDTEGHEGETGTTASAAAKDYTGFTLNPQATNAKPSGTITGDGKLVLRLYYDRNKYDVTYQFTTDSETPAGVTPPPKETNVKYEAGKEVQSIAVPEDYEFSGWETTDLNDNGQADTYDGGEPFTMPNRPVTFTGTFTAKKHTVRYVVDGKEFASSEEAYGHSVSVGPAPSVSDGRVFVGWETEQQLDPDPAKSQYKAGDRFTMPDENVTFTAVFSENASYHVKYEIIGHVPNGGSRKYNGKTTFLNGEEFRLWEPNAVDGYTFVGWRENGDAESADYHTPGDYEKIAGRNLNFHGWYEKVDAEEHTVKYFVGDKQVYTDREEKYKYNEVVTVREPYTLEGYEVSGWEIVSPDGLVLNADGKTFTMPDADVELRATTSINRYTVTYKYENGAADKIVSDNEYGAEFKIDGAEPEKTGYTFTGWKADVEIGGKDEFAAGGTFNMPAGNVTLTAQYKVNRYTVTYVDEDGKELGSVPDNEYNTQFSIGQADPSKTGHSFTGWVTTDVGGTQPFKKGDGFTIPAGDVTLTAQYEINHYTVTYVDEDGKELGSVPDNEYKSQFSIAQADPSKTGHSFTGWVTTDVGGTQPFKKGDSFTIPASNVTLAATYEINSYTVTYVDEDGKELGSVPDNEYKSQFSIGQADPSKTGYSFTGWVTTDVGGTQPFKKGDGFMIPAGDVTLTAQYMINSYTVTYMDGTEQVGDTEPYHYNDTVTVKPGTTRTGYTFAGWQSSADNQTYTQDQTFAMPTEDVTLTAMYTANVDTAYKVEHYWQNVDNDEFALHETENLSGTTGATVKAKAKSYEQFTFDDQVEGTLLTGNIAADGGLTLKLFYTRNIYDVVYVISGDDHRLDKTRPETESKRFEETVTVAGAPACEDGYRFIGWNTTDVTVDADNQFRMPDRKVTLTGSFEPIECDYTVNYYLGGTEAQYQTTDKVKESETVSAHFGDRITLDPSSLAEIDGYTPATTADQSITIGTDAEKNAINIYYYKNVTVTADDNGKMFGTEDPALTAAVDENGLFAGDTSAKIAFNTPERAAGENVGTYGITVDGEEIQGYYKVTYKPGKFTISASTALGVSGTDHTVVYNGKTYGEAATVSGPTADVTVEYSTDGGQSWSTTFPTVTDVADSTEVKVRASCENYKTAEDTYTLTVMPREVLLDGNQDTVNYDGETHSVSGVEAKGVGGKAESGLVDGHTIEGADFAVTDKINAGTYPEKVDVNKVTVMDGEKNVTANYEVKAGRDVQLTIKPLEITIKPVNVNETYDGNEHRAKQFEFVSGQLLTGDTLNVSYEGAAVEAGTYAGRSSIAAGYTITNGTGDVTGNYTVTTQPGDISINRRVVTLTSATDSKTYDGTPLTNSTVVVGGDGFAEGHGAEFEFTGSQTNVSTARASSLNTFTYTLTGGATEDNYDIQTYYGTLTVNPASITVQTGSASKVYNGEPLTNGSVVVRLGDQAQTVETEAGKIATVTLQNGETIGVRVTGTQTEVGDCSNEAIVSWNGSENGSFSALASNYNISLEYGKLVVTDSADEIVVTTTGGVFTYDGLPHRATVTVSELPDGYTLETAESDAVAQTVLDGTVEAKCDELVIVNAKGEDVTDALNIRYVNSRLIINPTPLTITTQSAAKEYDGEPLTAGVTVTGLVNGETVSVTAMGSQTEVGSSPNGYHVAWVGTAKVYNYEIVEMLGTLTVTAVGETPVPQPQDEDEDVPDVRVVETLLLEDEIVPLAGNTEKCCILHFLLALLALVTVLVSGHDTKKLQEKITELKKKESPDDGEDDGRTDGRKDDN